MVESVPTALVPGDLNGETASNLGFDGSTAVDGSAFDESSVSVDYVTYKTFKGVSVIFIRRGIVYATNHLQISNKRCWLI